MSDFTIQHRCPRCGEDELMVEVTIDSPSHPGYFGLPENSYPPEGADWHIDAAKCEHCGAEMDEGEIGDLDGDGKLNELVQERESEPPDPPEPEDY